MKTPEEAEPFVRSLVSEIAKANQGDAGDYVIIIQMDVDEKGTLFYTWKWFWKPVEDAPEVPGTPRPLPPPNG